MLIVVIVLIVSCIRNKVNKLVYQTNMEKVPFERKENYFKLLFSDYRYGKEIRLNNLKEFFLENMMKIWHKLIITMLKILEDIKE